MSDSPTCGDKANQARSKSLERFRKVGEKLQKRSDFNIKMKTATVKR